MPRRPELDEIGLDGRFALVTGAARGIGRAIATRLGRYGAEVTIVDLDAEAADRSAGEIAAETGATVRALGADVASEQGWEAIAAAAPRLDILVNNAGTVKIEPLAEQSFEDWRRVCAVNLDAALGVSKAVLGALRADGGGSIVNISSVAGLYALPGSGAYSASKAAVVSLTQQLAGEWGELGIRVNAIAPGLIRTAFAGGDMDDERIGEARARSVPIQRLGEPDDVARVAHFLVSELGSYVSGETVVVDGAWVQGFLGAALAVGRPAEASE
jgi:NAD(P)-dependent dehydrogenase (short-subunit alcohol dehydrogenase family)